jgi:hypothetical protein
LNNMLGTIAEAGISAVHIEAQPLGERKTND